MRTQTRDTQAALTPQRALELLKEGNARFQANLKVNRNLLEQANITADGQYPFAVILSCIDSRTSAELIFDQGLGDIFSIRIAGNVLNDDIVGSMEFACKLAGSKLIVILGHSGCGAVKGACDGVELGQEDLTQVEQKVRSSHNLLTLVTDKRGPRFGETFCKEETRPKPGFMLVTPSTRSSNCLNAPSRNQVVRFLTDWEGLRTLAV